MSRTLASIATWLPPEGEVLCRHDLAIALRFVDPFIDVAAPPLFARPAVSDRFIVRIDSLDWQAKYAPSDGGYRFSVSNANPNDPGYVASIKALAVSPQSPHVPIQLLVSVVPEQPDRATYFVSSPFQVTLPVSGPFVTQQDILNAYLREVTAFPTPQFRAPAGETCIRGTVVDNTGAALVSAEVAFFDAPGVAVATPAPVPANIPYTRTDSSGFFAYRLPWLKRPSPLPASPTLRAAVRSGAVTFLNATVNGQAGPVAYAPFTYGATTSIAIQTP